MKMSLAPSRPADPATRQRRDAVLVAYLTAKNGATLAQIRDDCAARCGGPRGVRLTVNRLTKSGAIALRHGNGKPGVYVVASVVAGEGGAST